MQARAVGPISLGLVSALAPAAIAAGIGGPALYEQIHRSAPGLATALTGALLRGATDLATALAMGALVLVLFLHPRSHREADRLRFGPDLTLLTWAAAAWTLLAGAGIVVSAADDNGLPLSRVLEPGALGRMYSFGYMPRAWTVSFVGAAVLWACAHFGTRWTTLLPGLWAGTIGALAPVVVGQVLVGPNHDIGNDAGTLQTLATTLLLGPLLAEATLRAGRSPQRPALPLDARRRDGVVIAGLLLALATEAVLTWFKLAGSGLTDSATGLLEAARILLLLAAAALWILHRRRPRLPLSAAAVALTLWLGVGAAMTRVPPPQYFVPTSIAQVFMGYETPEAPTMSLMVQPGRLNLLFTVLAVAGVVGYLLMVRRVHRRGLEWPVSRTVLWCAGWLVVVLATDSGFGKYSAPHFAAHMVMHMSLAMLAPILLVQGAVVTLALRAAAVDRRRAGPRAWIDLVLQWRLLRVLYHPALVFVVFVGSFYLLYFTPLFGTMMRFHWAHQVMNVHFLLTGYLYYSLIVGIDRPPRPLPPIGRLAYTLAAMPFHAFLGVAIYSSPSILARTYFEYLDMPWADLASAQTMAGAVAWAGGELPLIIAVIALCFQWARQDEREARRRDRHFDRGLDHEFDAYNEMLEKLSERQGPR